MYLASVTDCPTHQLSISIDGRRKAVEDYVGTWVGMPAVVQELEDAVDAVAETKRWVSGVDGLVAALRAENFDFGTFDAQVIVKEASTRGETRTVAELLDSGVSVKPMPAPKPKEAWMPVRFEGVRWLTAAAGNPETLALLIQREVSKNDQADKKLALAKAAESGRLTAVRALIGYGANPNAELKHRAGTGSSEAAESVLIDAAKSGNPEVVREILSYHPQLEARDGEGKTALFAAGEYESSDVDGARAECVRLLVRAGANVNARDKDGNTPLHETYLTEVEEELLKLGADVNARNKDGETPIFTTVDLEAIALFAAHGADFSIRNKKGQTAYEAAAQYRGAAMQEALLAALQKR
jgi:ankyrin repeat protein